MKNKIMIFMLLFSFLVGLVSPSSARAEDAGYAFNEWCEDNGLVCGKASDEDWSSADVHFSYDPSCIYIVTQGGSDFYLTKVMASVDDIGLYLYSKSNKVYAKSLSSSKAFSKYVYKYSNDGWHFLSSASPTLSTSQFTSFITDVSQSSVVYTNVSLYSDESLSGVPLVSVTEKPYVPYLFNDWCIDAGLNCAASSNESDSVIPFWYEPSGYNYIVSKNLTASTNSNVYNLLMIQKSDGAHYPYHFHVNDMDYLGIAGAFSDISMFTIRKFNYDSDGGGWKLIKRYDIGELPFDHADFTFDENTIFLYSDTDIYADRAASSVWQPASTGYYNVDIPEPDSPTPIPTTAPGSGSSPSGGGVGGGTRPESPDIGDDVESGGGLDFIISLFSKIWTDICSVEMSVDGYSISLQQIFVYGALVSIVGGFIMHFIFGRK